MVRATVLGIILLGLVGCTPNDMSTTSKPSVSSDESLTAQQLAANKAMFEAQKSMNERVTTLQMEVAKQCVAHGDIPVFINQNVDCKSRAK